MQARGLQPNKTTWCYLISSFTKVRRKGRPYAKTAYQLWRELLQLQPEGLDAPSFATGQPQKLMLFIDCTVVWQKLVHQEDCFLAA